MDNQNTFVCFYRRECRLVLILVLMDNQNTEGEKETPEQPEVVLILVLMDNQNTFSSYIG